VSPSGEVRGTGGEDRGARGTAAAGHAEEPPHRAMWRPSGRRPGPPRNSMEGRQEESRSRSWLVGRRRRPARLRVLHDFRFRRRRDRATRSDDGRRCSDGHDRLREHAQEGQRARTPRTARARKQPPSARMSASPWTIMSRQPSAGQTQTRSAAFVKL